MYRGMRVAVVIPAFNEERAIAQAVRAVPDFVDGVVVIDDASKDGTASILTGLRGGRVHVVSHAKNRGVGAAIVSGYRYILDAGYDVAAVMAGDGQMAPEDLPGLLDPIADGSVDYTKGNRFAMGPVWNVMPVSRIVGNLALSYLTRAATGYWHLFDSQCGYTAITKEALSTIELDRLFSRYGYPNDLLGRLAAIDAEVQDVAVKPVYGDEWKSGIRIPKVVVPLCKVLGKAWLRRKLYARKNVISRRTPGSAKVRAAG